MEFTLTENQQAIIDLGQQIFRDQVPDTYRQRTVTELDRNLWQILAEAGLLGLCLDERYGGSALELLPLANLLEAQGQVLAPLPLLEHSAACLTLQRYADENICQQWLPQAATGEALLGVAFDGLNQPLSKDAQLSADSNGWLLNGCWSQLPFGRELNAVIVCAELDGNPALVLVNPTQNGATLTQGTASNGLPWDQLVADQVHIAPNAVLVQGAAGESAREWLAQVLMTGISALQLGVVSEALKRTAEYTSERKQFNRPVASFQAVSHRAADGYIDCEALRSTVWQASWRLSEGLDAEHQARAAKWWACEAGHRIAHSAQHLHGGIGSDQEYPIHHFFLWAKQLEFTLGGAQQQLSELGAQLAQNYKTGAYL